MLSLCACSLDDETPRFFNEALPIVSVEVPETFVFGEVYPITATYLRPTGCHIFNSFSIDNDGTERTVFLINTVYQDQDCTTFTSGENEVEASFNFQVNDTGVHTFKFWQGQDENGVDLYYVVDVPVVE